MTIETLDDLLNHIKHEQLDDQTMSNLPNFGGEMPADTTHIWSWDEDRLLVGTCQDDYEIITREQWDEL